MSEIENRSSSSSNKRGPYLQYLAGRDVKIPKVSKWRRQLNVPTTHECDGLSLPEVNFEEENSSLLDETNKDVTRLHLRQGNMLINNSKKFLMKSIKYHINVILTIE